MENLPILKLYILNRLASSAFNCCERQPLKLIDYAFLLILVLNPELFIHLVLFLYTGRKQYNRVLTEMSD